MSARTLVIAAFILLLLFVALHERRADCPAPHQSWVLSDRGWICLTDERK